MGIFNYSIWLWSSIYSNPCEAATSKVVYKLDSLVNLVKNMSLHEVNGAADIDQQTGRIKRKLLRQMATEIQKPLLVIRLGQREIRLMRMK